MKNRERCRLTTLRTLKLGHCWPKHKPIKGKQEEEITRNQTQQRDKEGEYCEHCNRIGHMKESCFKLHGFPDWYKKLKEHQGNKSTTRNFVNAVDTQLKSQNGETNERKNDQQNSIASIVRKEIIKLMKGRCRWGKLKSILHT